MNSKVYVYFDLVATEFDSDDGTEYDTDSLESEWKAYQQAQKLFKSFGTVNNEGHDDYALLCFFAVERNQLQAVVKQVNDMRGGGDDIIYLDNGYQLQGFEVVDEPGISPAISIHDYAI